MRLLVHKYGLRALAFCPQMISLTLWHFKTSQWKEPHQNQFLKEIFSDSAFTYLACFENALSQAPASTGS